ncbi:uncharacterized protein MELLADRAFT_89169 [Melampsora larici-populina 98AG31]|uniref:Uncharacterized protein n=1 Tax=Melampsora larici-populina (strain 98AG31 / pathotype 3-4-7) TaxID=747676 RepID=F4R579_MELLP|nr:uncharacterized protein MELLADRAFT_89169 [Melampsora larici-populina 98AG31]EGG12309.1 hypothetical protein MELLADRAFT_89169 [Melampsora larici-populina 98AG31]
MVTPGSTWMVGMNPKARWPTSPTALYVGNASDALIGHLYHHGYTISCYTFSSPGHESMTHTLPQYPTHIEVMIFGNYNILKQRLGQKKSPKFCGKLPTPTGPMGVPPTATFIGGGIHYKQSYIGTEVIHTCLLFEFQA